MADIPAVLKRKMTEEALRSEFEAQIEQRVDRYMEIAHQGVIAGHHFAAASAECIRLYTDGYFISTVMVTQAVAEGIRDLVAGRNGLGSSQRGDEIVKLLRESNLISQECSEAFLSIYGSYRADVHHMNPTVGEIDFQSLAKKNIQYLACIEHEIFSFEIRDGRLAVKNPKYWDIKPDGTAGVYLRLEP